MRLREERKRRELDIGDLVSWKWGTKETNLHLGIVVNRVEYRPSMRCSPDIFYDVLWSNGKMVEQFSSSELCLFHVVREC